MSVQRFFGVSLVIIVATLCIETSVQASAGKNYIAPTVSFGLETTKGINSKFVVADHVSIRPFLEFGSNDKILSFGTAMGSSITYDFSNSPKDLFQPFVGIGYEVNDTQTRTLEPSMGFFGVQTFTQKQSRNFFVEAGSDFNVSPGISINTRVRIPLEDTGRDPTFSIGTGFRF
jgi:outer membrane protein W